LSTEDPLLSIDEGLVKAVELLQRILPREPAVQGARLRHGLMIRPRRGGQRGPGRYAAQSMSS
jgi:hypothetical protein